MTAVPHDLDQDRMRALLVSTQPDCVLLDGLGYRTSNDRTWQTSAWLSSLEPTVPVVMVTAHIVSGTDMRHRRDKSTLLTSGTPGIALSNASRFDWYVATCA